MKIFFHQKFTKRAKVFSIIRWPILFFPILGWAGIHFIHIPKTGGLTISALLDSHYKSEEIYPHRDAGQLARNTYDKNMMTEVLRAFPPLNRKLTIGHFPFWFFQNKDPHFETSYIFTVLRDPVERVISSYFYQGEKEKKLNSPLDVIPNRMCKMLCSDVSLRGEALLEDCIQNLKKMSFLIFMDDFEEGIRRLFRRLELGPCPLIPHRNSSHKMAISQELIEEIKKANELDVRLYEYASQNLRYKSY